MVLFIFLHLISYSLKNNQNMNLKKQIAKFRSQILIGQYQSAISISKSIMTQLQVQRFSYLSFMALKIIKDDRLYSYIQQEYQKCLSIKNFIHNKIRLSGDQGVKKWGNKQTSKWKKKQDLIQGSIPPSQQQLKAKENENNQKQSEQSPTKIWTNQKYMQLLQKIERQIMMPIKMPSFFKGQSNEFKLTVVPEQSYAFLLTYFIQNDFMSIQYEAFEYQFSKSVELNYFYQNNITEVLIDCKYMSRQQINLSKQKRNLDQKININCIFISKSQENQYLIL